jgi:hypothetical protein
MNHLFLRKQIQPLSCAVTVFVLVLLCSLPAAAQNAGYDLLQTGSGAYVDVTNLGRVTLQGVAIQSSLGTTDTIMHRTKDTPGGGDTPVDVTALFMKSTKSYTVGTQQVDIYVTLNNSNGVISTSVLPQPDALTASSGTVSIHSDGTFDSTITVNADLIFVNAGTSVTNPANYVNHQAAPSITLTSSGSTWSSTPPPGYPSSPSFPSGGFYPTPVHTGPHPVTPSTCNTGTTTTASPQSAANANTKQSGQATTLIAVKACVAATAQ